MPIRADETLDEFVYINLFKFNNLNNIRFDHRFDPFQYYKTNYCKSIHSSRQASGVTLFYNYMCCPYVVV